MSESRTPPTGPSQQRGATSVSREHRGGRKKGLLFAGLLLGALLLLALLLSQCGGNDPAATPGAAGQTSPGTAAEDSASSAPSSAPSSGSASAGSSTAPGSGPAAAGGGQVVTGDGPSVLDLVAAPDAAGSLAAVGGQPVTGTGVRVLSVPADEGFWVGTSDAQRVWVQLTGEAGESPYQVTEGDVVDFAGGVVAHDPGFAEQVVVDQAEGAEQLDELGQHLEVAKSAVRLSA